MKTAQITLLTGFITLSIASTAFAQATPPPPPRQELTAEVAFVGTTGNTSTSTFSAGAEHIARPTNWLIKNAFLTVRGEADNVVTAESLLYGLRAERAINTRAAAFGEYGYFRDELSGVSHRNQVTGGVAFKAATGPRNTFTVDVGAGYLSEQRLAGADISSGIYAVGTSYRLKISDNATLTDDIRILGTFDNSDDWRASHAISLTAKLTSALALKVSNTVRYMHFPPPGFKTTDTITSAALVVSFKKN